MASTHAATAYAQESGLAGRLIILGYSGVSYTLSMAAMLWLVASLAGLIPFGTGPISTVGTAAAVGVNAALLVLFGLQHSIMARKGFKHWWTRIVPPAAERSTYVLSSGTTLALAVWLWQPMDTVVWSISGPALQMTLWALFGAGWLYLVAATFVTNHFDLFGLRQAWLHFRGRPYEPVPFVRRWMYRYSRHPMMAGILVGFWATPHMQLDHLLLAAGMSAYVAVGLAFEERGLRAQFGTAYDQYRREAGALLPRLPGGRK